MVKNNEKYFIQAQIEIKILSLIKSKDPISANNCIDLKNYFSFRKRIVLFHLHSACVSGWCPLTYMN